MLANHLLSLKTQTPARFAALRFSYGIQVSPSTAARARALAPSVQAIRPGIYSVGACVVSLWSSSCSCKSHRTARLAGKPRPCAHFLALYLAGVWTPNDPDPVAYLRKLGVMQPRPIAIYCHAALPACYPAAPQGFRVLRVFRSATTGEALADLENVATGTNATAPAASLTRVYPFYE